MQKGPAFDKFLMRTKDIVWLLGIGWAIFKGIDAYRDRIKNLEALSLSTNVGMTNINKKLREISEQLNEIEYPERYKRKRRIIDEEE